MRELGFLAALLAATIISLGAADASELQTQFEDFKSRMIQKTNRLEETIDQVLEDNTELWEENAELKEKNAELKGRVRDLENEQTVLRLLIDDLSTNTYTKREADRISTGLSTQIDDLAAKTYRKRETNARFALQTDFDTEIDELHDDLEHGIGRLEMEIASYDYVSGDELETVKDGIFTLTNLINDLDTNTYSKSEVDGISNGLNTRVDDISNGLNTRVDDLESTRYTKSDVDALLGSDEYVWCTGPGCTVEFVLAEETEVQVLCTDFSDIEEYLTVFVDNAQQSETCDPGVDNSFDTWKSCKVPAGTIKMESTAEVDYFPYTNADLGITNAQVVVRIPTTVNQLAHKVSEHATTITSLEDTVAVLGSDVDNTYTKSESDSRFAYNSHYHDYRYYTKSESNSRYAAALHTHDTRYYTQSESNNRFAYKFDSHSYAAASHTHDERYYTESESNSRYAYKSHTHSYAAASHTHDDRYFTESESDARYIKPSSFGMENLYYAGAGTHETGLSTSRAFCALNMFYHHGINNDWSGCRVNPDGTWKMMISQSTGGLDCMAWCLTW